MNQGKNARNMKALTVLARRFLESEKVTGGFWYVPANNGSHTLVCSLKMATMTTAMPILVESMSPRKQSHLAIVAMQLDGRDSILRLSKDAAAMARRTVFLLDVSAESFFAYVMLRHYLNRTSGTRLMCGINDKWLSRAERIESQQVVAQMGINVIPSRRKWLRNLEPFRRYVVDVFGERCADLLFAGKEVHSEAFATHPRFAKLFGIYLR